jgi:hypothetical protein
MWDIWFIRFIGAIILLNAIYRCTSHCLNCLN